MSEEPIKLSLREAWRVARGRDGDHPGYYPGSPEDFAHREAEKERRARSEAMWAAEDLRREIALAAWRNERAIAALERSIQRRFDRCCHGRRA